MSNVPKLRAEGKVPTWVQQVQLVHVLDDEVIRYAAGSDAPAYPNRVFQGNQTHINTQVIPTPPEGMAAWAFGWEISGVPLAAGNPEWQMFSLYNHVGVMSRLGVLFTTAQCVDAHSGPLGPFPSTAGWAIGGVYPNVGPYRPLYVGIRWALGPAPSEATMEGVKEDWWRAPL